MEEKSDPPHTRIGGPAGGDLIEAAEVTHDHERKWLRDAANGLWLPATHEGEELFRALVTEAKLAEYYAKHCPEKIDRAATGERLFEGQAQAISTSNRLQYLVPNLVEAMFTDFPGNSGETLRISIAPEKTTVRKID